MFFKTLLLFIISINLTLPFNDKLDIIILALTILMIILTKSIVPMKEIYKKRYYALLIILFTSINLLIPKLEIHEAHSVFLNLKGLDKSKEHLPKQIFNKITNDYKNNIDIKRFLKSHDDWRFSSEKIFSNFQFINTPYAFSTDSFFQKNKYTRIVNNINFLSREDLRIGQINSLNYNLPFDKHLRRILPFYVFFEIPKLAHNSEICSNGNLYFYMSSKTIDLTKLSTLTFKQIKNNECIKFDSQYNNLYLIGYSINGDDNLSISLEKNLKLKFYHFLKYFLIILIILIYVLTFCKIKFSYNFNLYLISIISTLILTLIRDTNLFFGLRYYRGGADGLMHYSYGRDILQNIANNNFLMALRGGEDVFYYMPGLRYFSSFNNLIFGETTYGYLLACTFIPYLIFKIFEHLINKKIATYLFISFVFLPIFENMGFGYFNYIWQFARHHAESLSIVLFLYALYQIIVFEKKPHSNNSNFFFIGLALSSLVFLRPNFFPTSFFLFIYLFYSLYNYKKYNLILTMSLGYIFILTCFFHNLYFGNSLIFFTDAGVNFKLNIKSFINALIAVLNLDFNNSNFEILQSQLSNWNPLYNLHRLIILFFITFMIFFKKQNLLIYTLFCSMLCQHGLLLLSHPSSRYAYLAWLLTFIIFVNSIFQIKFKKS